VNPNSVKFTMRAQLSGSDLAAFKRKLASLLNIPSGAATRDDVKSAQIGAKKPDKA
jgi:hypothetical protein